MHVVAPEFPVGSCRYWKRASYPRLHLELHAHHLSGPPVLALLRQAHLYDDFSSHGAVLEEFSTSLLPLLPWTCKSFRFSPALYPSIRRTLSDEPSLDRMLGD